MNPSAIFIGIMLITYGVYVFVLRLRYPKKLRKLAAMQTFWGETLGAGMHTISYIVVPIILGITVVMGGMNGHHFLEMMR